MEGDLWLTTPPNRGNTCKRAEQEITVRYNNIIINSVCTHEFAPETICYHMDTHQHSRDSDDALKFITRLSGLPCSHWDILHSSDSLSHAACIYTLHLTRLSLCDILKGTRNDWLNLNMFRLNTCVAHMKKIQHRVTCMCNKKVTVMWYSFDISCVLKLKHNFQQCPRIKTSYTVLPPYI